MENIKFDVWTIKNNWAFKSDIYETNRKNIKLSSFFNFDSVLINLTSKDYDFEYFNLAVKENKLDILIPEKYIFNNPTPELNITKSFIVHNEWDFTLSSLLKNYIRKYFKRYLNELNKMIDRFINVQKKHYGKIKLSSDELKEYIWATNS